MIYDPGVLSDPACMTDLEKTSCPDRSPEGGEDGS
jgi:hypothetical protein